MTRAPRNAPAAKCDDGFTLLEMLVVLSILAITAVVVVPRADGTRHGKALQAAAAGLAAEFRSARADAIRTNTEQTLTIDTLSRRYRREGWTDSRDIAGQFAIALDTIRSEQTGSSAGRIRFYPDGSATGGRVMLGSGPRRAVVSIDWLTGGTRVSLDN